MERLSAEELEKTRCALERHRPLKASSIDFKNPYFTQPKHTLKRDAPPDVATELRDAVVKHVYVHVPFCATKCRYCHYPTLTNDHSDENQRRFVATVDAEIKHYRDSGLDLAGVSTVHVGGGTPSCLDDEHLTRLLTILQDTFHPATELAVELYPTRNDLTASKLEIMRGHGVNRLSIGIQTFDDRVNEQNRRTNQDRATALELTQLAKAYCANVSIDLLYGQVGQDLAMFAEDCAVATELDVNSIYLYQTRELIHKNAVELQLALNLFLKHFEDEGYDIVSFDQVIKRRNSDGFCEHRSGRSLSENLLGVGPAAVSEIGELIFRNQAPASYGDSGVGPDPSSVVRKEGRTLRAEYINRALRHYNYPGLNGTWLSKYRERFASNMVDDFRFELDALRTLGLVQFDHERIEVTDLGMHFTQHINYYLLEHYK